MSDESNVIPLVRKYQAIDLEQVTKLAALRLTSEQICALLPYPVNDFRDQYYTEDSALRAAYDLGKAKAIKHCASIILLATNGELVDAETGKMGLRELQQYKAAQYYLEKHGQNWLK